jgi:hypothetical protein
VSQMWSVPGALFVAALWGVPSQLSGKGLIFNPGQWIAYLAWVLWTLSGIAVVWTFLDESEPRGEMMATPTLGGGFCLRDHYSSSTLEAAVTHLKPKRRAAGCLHCCVDDWEDRYA